MRTCATGERWRRIRGQTDESIVRITSNEKIPVVGPNPADSRQKYGQSRIRVAGAVNDFGNFASSDHNAIEVEGGYWRACNSECVQRIAVSPQAMQRSSGWQRSHS